MPSNSVIFKADALSGTISAYDASNVLQFTIVFASAGITLKDQTGLPVLTIDPAGNVNAESLAVLEDIACVGSINIGNGMINLLNTGLITINSTQVITDQQAAVADATGAGDVVAQLNSLLAKLRTHGLIAT